MKHFVTALALLALTACATCDRHPIGCAVGGALIVGGVAVATHGAHYRLHDVTTQPVVCGGENCR